MNKIQLPRCTPELQGIASAALLGFVEEIEKKIHELHSFMLLRHGAVVAEGWWSPYAPDRPAYAVFAEQELYLHRGGAGGRRRPPFGG